MIESARFDAIFSIVDQQRWAGDPRLTKTKGESS
jgi:hypothetical protein